MEEEKKGLEIYNIDYSSIIAQTPTGQIVEGVHIPTGSKVAVRMVIKKWWGDDIEEQILIEKKTQHPNLIKFYDVIYNPKSNFIITELADGGSIKDVMEKMDKIPLAKIREIAEMLWNVCRYLAKMNAMVRDLGPESIVICKDPVNGETVYKITNVGLTKVLLLKNQPNFVSPTIPYRAPEYNNPEINQQKVDLWSIGVVLYQLATNKLPFTEGEEPNPYNVNYLGIPKNLANLIRRLLVKDVSKRLNYNQFMSHPFFEENIEDEDETTII